MVRFANSDVPLMLFESANEAIAFFNKCVALDGTLTDYAKGLFEGLSESFPAHLSDDFVSLHTIEFRHNMPCAWHASDQGRIINLWNGKRCKRISESGSAGVKRS
jgi:hypothetical protein